MIKVKVIWGAPCSGKSTKAKDLMTDRSMLWDHDLILRAMTTRTDHVSSDNVASSIVRSMRRELFYQLQQESNEESVKQTDAVIVVASFVDDRLKDQLKPFEVEYIKCDATLEECLKRLQSDKSRPDKAAWKTIIEKWFEDHGEEEMRMKNPSFKEGAQIRNIAFNGSLESKKLIDSENYVEGYAALYEPYLLYNDDAGPVYEQFERNCFNGCDMSDIILQYDHAGKVFARTGNGTLIVEHDDKGLFVAADLSKTAPSRELYESIKAGMVTKMSWRFAPGDYEYVPETRTIVHHTVKKIYDVSAVSIPANDNTEINARSWADGVIDLAARREAELDYRRRKLKLRLELMEVTNASKRD